MTRAAILCLALQLLALPAAGAPQTDARGCQDHQLFTRMPDFWIHSCQEKGFDTHDFPVAKGKTERVEGHMWKINYYPQADAKVRGYVAQHPGRCLLLAGAAGLAIGIVLRRRKG